MAIIPFEGLSHSCYILSVIFLIQKHKLKQMLLRLNPRFVDFTWYATDQVYQNQTGPLIFFKQILYFDREVPQKLAIQISFIKIRIRYASTTAFVMHPL